MELAAPKTPRDHRTERIGTELLAAAHEQFLAHGFHGATLDRIAAAAGYTKGVVYSRFAGKGDLFLALLERRIEDRARENAALAEGLRGVDGLAELARRWTARQREDLSWTLLVLEFRVHAARTPQLEARYAALHERTLEGLAEVVRRVLGRVPPARARRIAQTLHSSGNGATLEQAVDPDAFAPEVVVDITRALVKGLR